VTRRTFVKGTATAGGLMAASRFFDGGLLTLVAEGPESAATALGEE
jgi:hypothetical protein